MEFVEMVSAKLPVDGVHVSGWVHEGRGFILHSREACDADLAAIREALSSGRENALAFAAADVTGRGHSGYVSGVRLPAFWVLGQYLSAGFVRPR